eukprot:XP_008187319.1 PREDICTED: uncharacterized protein LOC103310527 [Acyrthosiphon pisum]
MVNEKGSPPLSEDLKAPKYTELFNAVTELRNKLSQLETSRPTMETVSAPTVDYRILPDVGTAIWTFTGHESSAQAEDWVSSVDGLAQVNQWPLRHHLLYVRSHLSSAARSWYLMQDFLVWEDFLKGFRKAFVRTLRKADLWRELEARIQAPGEPTIDYFYAKVGLCRSLDLTFNETRDYVLEGLRSQQQSDWVFGRRQTDIDEILGDMREWERMRTQRNEKFDSANPSTAKLRQPKSKPPAEPTNYRPDKDVVSLPKTSTDAAVATRTPSSEMSSSQATYYCYNCRAQGHISRDCPKPKRPMKCTNCNSNRHTVKRCPTVATDSSATAPAADQAYRADATTMSGTSKNPFIKTVYVNGRPVNGLIDTGSSAVLIRSSIARECGLIVRDTVCPLFTVGNADAPSTMTIGEGDADVTIDNVLAADHTLKVVPDKSLPVDVLVGRTWLDLPHVNYYKQAGEIVFETSSCVPADVLAEPLSENIFVAESEPVRPPKEPITTDDVVFGAEVTDAQRESLIVLVNEHRDVFAKNIMALGCTNAISMDIAEIPDSSPVSLKPYRTSPTDRHTIAETLRDWKKAGIITDSSSPYASPVLLVNKSSGEKRLCVDYRRLNQQTVDQPYPMPDVDTQLGALSHGVIFTTLDLSNGFLQIPLTPAAKEKTAFVTEETTAKFERMPFGLKGAPGTFQKLIGTAIQRRRGTATRQRRRRFAAQRIKWFGHVMRRSNFDYLKAAAEWKPTGKRPRGRPKKRWIDGIKQDLEKLGISNWEEKVQNREEWRELSVAVKTLEEL